MTPGAALLTPLTRKENYLNEIVGWGNTAPEKPLTTEELFFAAILGKAVQAPEPLTRYQMYLAKIAGRDIEIPYPETRLEYFLARAAGMDVETPVPITREEIFWSNYSAIVEFEVEGVPPLTYKAIEGTLENYRIFGNTVGGESVGDLVESGEHAGEYKVPVTVSNGTDTLTTSIYLPEQIRKVGDEAEYIDYGEQKQHRVRKNLVSSYTVSNVKSRYGIALNFFADLKPSTDYILTFTVNSNGTDFYTNEHIFGFARYISPSSGNKKIVLSTIADISTSNINQYILEKGWTILKNNSNHDEFSSISNVQLRLASIEDNTYEPYIENIDVDVTLPALPTLPGTNVLSVGTAVQPSKVYIKYKGERQ